FSLLGTGFFVVLLLTALFGRVYCSVICPLGIMQDFVSWIRRKTKKKVHRYKYGKAYNYWRYGFLALPFIILLAGRSLIGLNLLDPYSIFGRIFSDLGQPVYMWMNNLLARLLESMNIYVLYPEDVTAARGLSYIIPALMLLLVVWFSFYRGRLYCNTICPVGTLLGLLSRISVFRIRMIESRCTKCAKCVFTCKASCIDMKNLDVDFSRCVGCLNCLKVCPEDAIKYMPAGAVQQNPNEPAGILNNSSAQDSGRREAISRMLVTGLALAGLSRKVFSQDTKSESSTDVENKTSTDAGAEVPSDTITKFPTNVENKIPTEIEPVKNFPVSPPGSLGLRHFKNRCSACHLCISACPTGVLQPSINEYGLEGLLQPHMDYSSNYCNFECVRCAEVCPTGAILSLTEEAKKTLQLGQVQLILENCVVYAENTACGSCSEHCPTQAVTMVPFRDGLTLPEIKPKICVGCGACEYACPVRPHKAIYVDGHEIHQVAEKPEIEELEKTEMEEFPF
ncbi:4Fe-4S binding protein, partial [Bacteroidota bacterium]